MKFGTFLIIEACANLGYVVSTNTTTRCIALYNKRDELIFSFIASNVDSFSDEFYQQLKVVTRQYKIQYFSSELHRESKQIRSNNDIMKRWEKIKARTTGLNKILS
jgi:hypothetical protein